jgi:hypothetical protein
MQVAIQSLHVNGPVNMHDEVAKAYHLGHPLGILVIQVTRPSQDEKDIPLYLRPLQSIHGNNVVPYIGATFRCCLKGSFDG